MKKITLALMLSQVLTVASANIAFGDNRVGPMASDDFQPGQVVCPLIAQQMHKRAMDFATAASTQSAGKRTSEAR